MKVRYKVSQRMELEFDCETVKQAVKTIFEFESVFTNTTCGDCGSRAVRCDYREIDGNSYYSLACCSCGSSLNFGQKKDGRTIYAKPPWRKFHKRSGDEDGQEDG